jgi:hypothetical protein
MSIPAADIALLESRHHGTPDVYLNAWPLRIVGTATVNQGTFDYPVAQLTVSGASAGWTSLIAGQMVRILDGSDIITTGVVRQTPTSSTELKIDAKHLGDPGRPQLITGILANAQSVVVYDFMPLWAILSRISSGVFYKYFDIPYVNQNLFPNPVANIGEWRQAFVNTATNKATLTFTTSGSFDWNGLSLTQTWVLPATGATLVSGTLSSATIGVEFDPGFYLMQCTISNGTTSRLGLRPVWINTKTGANAPLSRDEAIVISADRQSLAGRDLSLQAYGTFTETQIFAGDAVMLSEYASHGGSVLSSSAGFVDNYVGYIQSEVREGRPNGVDVLSMDVRSPFGELADIALAPQLMDEADTPANWTEIKTGLGRPDFIMWYLLNWHCPNMLTMFDFFRLSDSPAPRKRNWSLSASTVQAGLQEAAGTVGANVGSSSDGALYIRRNPVLESTTYRTAMAEQMTLNEDHITEKIEYSTRLRRQVGKYTLYAFSVNSSNTTVALAAQAGGTTQGQGPTKTQGESFLVVNQTEINEKCGNLLALENTPTPELTLRMDRNFDIFDPARDYDKWWALDIDASYDPRGVGFLGRINAMAVDREWTTGDNGAIHKHISLVVRPETQSSSGETDEIEESGIPAEVIDPTVFVNIGTPDYVVGNNLGLATDGGYGFAFTTDFNNTSPTYTLTLLSSLGYPGTGFWDFNIDAYSSKYLGTSSSVDGWGIVDHSGTDKIIAFAGLGSGTITPTALFTFTGAISSGSRHLHSERGDDGVVGVVSHSGGFGTKVTLSTDGAAFSAEAVLTSDTPSGGWTIGLPVCVSGRTNYIYACAFGAGVNTFDIWRTTNYSSWSLYFSVAGNLRGSMHIPFDDNDGDVHIYVGGWADGAGANSWVYHITSGVAADITPVYNGIRWSPNLYTYSINSCPTNRLKLGLCGFSRTGGVNSWTFFLSEDGGATWTPSNVLDSGIDNIRGCHIAPDGQGVYLFGTNQLSTEVRFWYSPDFGTTWYDKTSNLGALGITGIVNIFGT